MLYRMGSYGKVVVQRLKYQPFNPHYAESIITHCRGNTIARVVFSRHSVDLIVKISAKINRYQHLHIQKNKMEL